LLYHAKIRKVNIKKQLLCSRKRHDSSFWKQPKIICAIYWFRATLRKFSFPAENPYKLKFDFELGLYSTWRGQLPPLKIFRTWRILWPIPKMFARICFVKSKTFEHGCHPSKRIGVRIYFLKIDTCSFFFCPNLAFNRVNWLKGVLWHLVTVKDLKEAIKLKFWGVRVKAFIIILFLKTLEF